MGLKESIQNLMPKVITALGTLASTAIYHSTGTFTYDATTGINTEVNGINKTTACVVVEYTQEELMSNERVVHDILITDKKVLIPKISLGSIVPKMTDYLTISSVVYKVINKSIDPAEAMWEIQVRI